MKFLPVVLMLAAAFPLEAAESDSMFGSSKRTAGALIGILYDFKQDQKRQKLPIDRDAFEKAVAQFVESGYDEGLINKYYRVPRALYTTQLQIPTIDADSAPKAFGVEKTVEPQKWMVHYKGQISAPEDGEYRFLGDADDFVIVAINGKTVLVAEMPGTPMGVKWYAKEAPPGRFQAAGDWVHLRAGGSRCRHRGISRRTSPLPALGAEKGRPARAVSALGEQGNTSRRTALAGDSISSYSYT
jgi:hypothetical protein